MTARRSSIEGVLARAGVGLAVIGATTVGVAVNTAGAYDIPVLQWNMKGGNVDMDGPAVARGNGGVGLEAANHLISSIGNSTSRPWHVMLNEVCLPQFNHLNSWLSALGYSGSFHPSNGYTGSDCVAHGNALFTLGSASASTTTFVFPAGIQADEADRRRISCRNTTTFVDTRKACVSHLVPKAANYTKRVQQDSWAADWVTNLHYSSLPTVVGMDRNMTDRFPHWGQSYKEVDNRGTLGLGFGTFPSYSSSRDKMDFVFASFNGHGSYGGKSTKCDLGGMSSTPGRFLSDHCMLVGNYVN